MALQIPGYVIHREIGAGGMAKVFLATQTSLDRQVALKVMSPALATDPTFAKRFQREARTIAGLTHPNIVAVYEVGSVQHMHFFAMQHLAGGDLAGKLRKGIPEPEVVRIVSGVARALGFAHSRGVVHRDVTPGNILFDSTDNPVLTDFGIARSQQGSTRITHTGVSIGTSSYMSPEQARGGEVDARSDLYSLGALLFETLSGKPPYTGTDGFAVAYAHVFEPIPRLPPGLEHWQPLIEKAMAKAPEDRFANSDEFVAGMLQVPANPQRILPLMLKGSDQRNGAAAPLPAHAHTSAQQVAAAPARPQPAPAPAPAEASVPTQRVQVASLQALAAAPAPAAVPVAAPAPSNLPALRPSDAVVVSRTAETPIPPPPRNRALLAVIGVLVLGLLGTGLAWWQGWGPFAPGAPTITDGSDPIPPVLDPPATDPIVSSASSQSSSSASSVAPEPPVIPIDEQPLVGVDIDANGDTRLVDPALPPGELAPGELQTDPAAVEGAAEPFVGPPTKEEFMRPILNAAKSYLASGALTTPPYRNAFDVFRWAQSLDPGNAEARQGVLDTALAVEKQALDAYARKQLVEAMDLLAKADVIARTLGPKEPLIETLAARPKAWLEERSKAAAELEVRWKSDEAVKLYQEMLLIDKNSVAAAEGVKRASVLGKPGYQFRDALKTGGNGPTMVVVAPGNVSLRDDRGGTLAARVSKGFAMAQREVSLGEFRAYVNATGRTPGDGKGCKDREGFQMFVSKERTWLNPGFTQNERHPVVCIGFKDAEGYARWLSEQSGHRYALPSEPQWWLAAGNLPNADCKRANLGDATFAEQQKGRRALGCNDSHGATAPGGSFPPGANALYDMAGNVREWTADCFLRTVTGRGATEAPWTGGNCDQRLVLGTAWLSGSEEKATVPRSEFKPTDLGNTVGFRVVMELP